MGEGYFNVELRTEINRLLLPDTEASNNGDARAVLTTVSLIIEDFLAAHPSTIVHIKGSDDRRQRIYQKDAGRSSKRKAGSKNFWAVQRRNA